MHWAARKSSAAKMRAGGGLGIAAARALPAMVDDLAGFRAMVQAFEGDRWINHVAGHTPAGFVVGQHQCRPGDPFIRSTVLHTVKRAFVGGRGECTLPPIGTNHTRSGDQRVTRKVLTTE